MLRMMVMRVRVDIDYLEKGQVLVKHMSETPNIRLKQKLSFLYVIKVNST